MIHPWTNLSEYSPCLCIATAVLCTESAVSYFVQSSKHCRSRSAQSIWDSIQNIALVRSGDFQFIWRQCQNGRKALLPINNTHKLFSIVILDALWGSYLAICINSEKSLLLQPLAFRQPLSNNPFSWMMTLSYSTFGFCFSAQRQTWNIHLYPWCT